MLFLYVWRTKKTRRDTKRKIEPTEFGKSLYVLTFDVSKNCWNCSSPSRIESERIKVIDS